MIDYPSITDWQRVAKYYIKHFYKYLTIDLKWAVKSKFKRDLEPLKKLENSRSKTAAIILANGPSVGYVKQEKLIQFCKDNNLEVFGLNFMIKSELSKSINIDHFVWSDPEFLNPNDSDYDELILAFTQKNLTNFFLPFGYNKKVINDMIDLGINVVHFCDIEGSQVFTKSISPLKPRSYVSMTAYKSLAIALFMGYKKIYILGFDNSFFKNVVCDEANRLHRIQQHFDSKAYDNDGKKTLIFGGKRKMYQELIGNSRLFSDLLKFKTQSTEIINLDPFSLTDAFQKIDAFDLVSEHYSNR